MKTRAPPDVHARSRRAAALIVLLATFALHAALIPAQGLTDDDDFYAPAGIRYAGWLGDLLASPGAALSRAAVDVAFKTNHEHPPLAKLVFGATHAIAHEWLGVVGALDGARLGTALFAALLNATLVLLLWGPLGRGAALAAPLLLLSLPRFFFHSEVATLDVPVACAVVVVTAAFFWSTSAPDVRTRRRWEVLTGVFFGLALLVKLNAPFAAIPCLVFALLTRWRGFAVRSAAGPEGAGPVLILPPVPRALLWMAILGPVLFVGLWPWLWFETLPRIGAYVAFHLNHYPIYLFYDGEIWARPAAPWHAVVVLGFGVVPFPVLVLGALGALRAGRAILRLARADDDSGEAPDVSAADKLRALVLLQAVFAMAIVANPATPRYGGEKLFMPFFPLFCALAADGALLVVEAARVLAPRLSPLFARGALAMALFFAALPGFLATVKHHGGYALSYYGESVGGLRGAVARGYERTYYDVADKGLARFLDREAAGETVRFEPNHKEYVRTYRWLKRDGVIQGVRLTDDRTRAGYVVLTHERRWASYPALLEELRATRVPIYEKAIDGVPLYTVFKRVE
jgi:hypothetical protein